MTIDQGADRCDLAEQGLFGQFAQGHSSGHGCNACYSWAARYELLSLETQTGPTIWRCKTTGIPLCVYRASYDGRGLQNRSPYSPTVFRSTEKKKATGIKGIMKERNKSFFAGQRSKYMRRFRQLIRSIREKRRIFDDILLGKKSAYRGCVYRFGRGCPRLRR